MVKDCEYGEPEEMVRDRIVCGVLSKEVREKLLTQGDDLNMKKAIDIAVAHETTQLHLHSMNGASSSIDAVKERKPRRQQQQHRQDGKGKGKLCGQCGRAHQPRQCPAYGATCLKCTKKHHWAKFCRSNPKKVHAVEETEEEPETPEEN